jgi:hypothetical protein
MLPFVLYGCEIWSLTLWKEHRLRILDNRVLMRVCVPKSYEVAGNVRELHSTEVHNLYCSPSIVTVIESRRIRWAGHVARVAKGFFLYPLCPDRLWGPPSLLPVVLSPGLKRSRDVTLTTHPIYFRGIE